MFREKKEGYYYVEEFEKFGVEAIYTSEILEFNSPLIKVHGIQTHTKNVLVIDEKNFDQKKIPFKDTDGFITNRKDVVIYTKHADCLAIYFYDKKNSAIGLCHSGWKGSFDEIGFEAIKLFRKNYGTEPKDLLVALGIGISQKNYEVSKDFYEKFSDKFSEEIISKSFIKKEIIEEIKEKSKEDKKNIEENTEKYIFDNEIFNYRLMIKYGVQSENIFMSGLCTYEDKNLHSYRRDKENSGRNGAYIKWK
ncbi:MAG: peptidoglycan editing factor PgeF [Fusobacteriaceae bacterium]